MVPRRKSVNTSRTPEITDSAPPRTGIDYQALTAAAHHEQLRHDERIGYHALYGAGADHTIDTLGDHGQSPGQLSIADIDPGNAAREDEVSA